MLRIDQKIAPPEDLALVIERRPSRSRRPPRLAPPLFPTRPPSRYELSRSTLNCTHQVGELVGPGVRHEHVCTTHVAPIPHRREMGVRAREQVCVRAAHGCSRRLDDLEAHILCRQRLARHPPTRRVLPRAVSARRAPRAAQLLCPRAQQPEQLQRHAAHRNGLALVRAVHRLDRVAPCPFSPLNRIGLVLPRKVQRVLRCAAARLRCRLPLRPV
mmetsp:Transcript_32462/g.80750  ORF Transcript_32462/g.80750 Transcript_32462/m.80750 type:complete len:215 (-) Transcript_32462:118-762(-)